MTTKLFPVAIAMAWVTLPLTALHYAQNWERLPARIAVHFDANWQPNGWSSREGARMLALGTTACLLVTFTIAAVAIRTAKASSLALWAMVLVFYAALGFVYYVNRWIVDRNLPASSKPRADLVWDDAGQERAQADWPRAAARLEALPLHSGFLSRESAKDFPLRTELQNVARTA